MVAGKKRNRGPISKAIAHGEGLSKGIQIAAQNYQAGVSSAGDRWANGVVNFLRFYVPKVIDAVQEARRRYPDDPYARLRAVLKAESEIAKQYDDIAERDRLSKLKTAFGGAVTVQPSMAQAVAVSKRKEIRI